MQTVMLAELPAMTATLCSYENSFGPYHPQTLRLTTLIATAYDQLGKSELAVRLLRRVLRDEQRFAHADWELRLEATLVLREILGRTGNDSTESRQ